MPKVFMSYSYDNQEHEKWVFNLAFRLRTNGVDIVFDKFETSIGSDLPLFMEQGLNESTRVICICSEQYNLKANSGKSGVGYEKRIICQDLMKNSSLNYVIPLIRNNPSPEKLPKFLSSLKYISFEDDNKYEANYYELLRDLHGRSNLPPLGKNPFAHNEDVIGKIDEIISVKRTFAVSPNMKGRIRFNFLSNSGIHIFGIDTYEFQTEWSDCAIDSIYAYSDRLKAIAWASGDIDNLNLEDYDFSSRSRCVSLNENIIWINRHGKILITKIISIEWENAQNHWLTVDYKILEKLDA